MKFKLRYDVSANKYRLYAKGPHWWNIWTWRDGDLTQEAAHTAAVKIQEVEGVVFTV